MNVIKGIVKREKCVLLLFLIVQSMLFSQTIKLNDKTVTINAVDIRDEVSLKKALGSPDSVIASKDGVSGARWEYSKLGLSVSISYIPGKKRCELIVDSKSFKGVVLLDNERFDLNTHLYELLQNKSIVFNPIEIQPYPVQEDLYFQIVSGTFNERKLSFIYNRSPNNLWQTIVLLY